jgi:serine/threonine protein kinase
MLPAEVWSLGVLLSSVLTGEHPFLSPTDAAAGRRLPLKVTLSDGARDLMERCLTVDVSRRITLEEMRRHPWLVGKAHP